MNLVLEDTKSDPSIALEKIQLLDSRGINLFWDLSQVPKSGASNHMPTLMI